MTDVSSEIEEAWAKEVHARITEYDKGSMKVVSAAQVFTEARDQPYCGCSHVQDVNY